MTPIVRSLLLLSLFVCLLYSCRKNEFTDSADAELTTSVDTLHFDTVFTTTGSFTQVFKIVNDNDKGVRVNSIRLAGGVASPFKINVDGVPGPQVANTEIADNDSVYVFVTVAINPNTDALPFVVQDSIEISYNGNKQWVQLDAYGQNAHFFRAREITANEVWNNDLPYVILGGLAVDTNVVLTINKGTRIYMHADAPLIVDGTLKVNGEKWDSTRVVFTGDRLDEPYRNFPASYPGIIFTGSSKDNVLNYAIVRNAYQGIIAANPATNAAPKVTLNETIVENAYDIGVLGLNSSITARNLLVSNCGKNIVLAGGGLYRFNHCTVASYSNNYIQHKEPVLLVTDYVDRTSPTNPMDVLFQNSIFWGEGGLVENEVFVDKRGNAFNVVFDHVQWKVKTPPSSTLAKVEGTPITGAPVFDSINVSQRFFNFRLKEGSPGLNAGKPTGLSIDLDGAPRPVGLPDLGAYEKQ